MYLSMILSERLKMKLRYLLFEPRREVSYCQSRIDERMAEVFETKIGCRSKEEARISFNRDTSVLTAEPRLDAIAKDLVCI